MRGTVAEGAPIVAVSSVTGEGLDGLRAAIADALRALPERDAAAPAYLPIDRVFALAGHGTIVTGTLMQGAIAAGDALRLFPLERDVRARSVQVFGERRERVTGGSRVAVNLPGVDRTEIARGDVLGAPNLSARAAFAIEFVPRREALPLLRRRTPVRAYVGAAEILGTLVFAAAPARVEPVPAQLHLRTPTVGLPGAKVVLRRLSPKDLLGGGTIAGPGAAQPDGRRRRADRARPRGARGGRPLGRRRRRRRARTRTSARSAPATCWSNCARRDTRIVSRGRAPSWMRPPSTRCARACRPRSNRIRRARRG